MGMATTSNPRKIVKNGSSLAINLPPAVLEELDLEKGDRVVIQADSEQAVIEEVEWTKA